jgi:hypothetical protein
MTSYDEYRAVGFSEAQEALLARDSAASATTSQGMLDTLRAILAAVEGSNVRLDRLDERVGRIEEHLRSSPVRN